MTDIILKNLKPCTVPPAQYSPLALAYVGDCVYELYVRSYLLSRNNLSVNALHKTAVKYVCSRAQAEFFRKIEEELTAEELAVFRRGRNTKSTVPKNSEMSDYRTATGVEALIGFLYLSDRMQRVCDLMKRLFDEDND
ncbi:MAG TPA: Mini-ribonuclease 3 [Candidatus Monoglobus merdigallinarum]|uniref:Mini-ribonuclease 3 n=1 Tax=Candidatus Monoglobus merdigallinarum TaxID=2838698 RepID=A0A9D1PQ97_9FIRM|nr:Mini-ribonuclease 3 [Candidatus Monoglobus merdigallinarum]